MSIGGQVKTIQELPTIKIMKKSSIYIFISALLCLLSLSKCFFDIDDRKLRIFNDTNLNFYLTLNNDSILKIQDVSFIDDIQVNSISKAGDTTWPLFARLNQGGYVNMINKSCVDSTAFLYLFEIDSVKKKGWQSVVYKQQIFAKKGFKVKDLDSIKWLIKLSSIVSPK